MSAAARQAKQRRPKRGQVQHFHLPSVHIRNEGGGFDYEEDLYLGRGQIERVIRLTAVEHGQIVLARLTRDVLCEEELAELREILPELMQEGDPTVAAEMEERGRREFARQLRIAGGAEGACRSCGCSETRACSGGCIWVTPHLCSRCL